MMGVLKIGALYRDTRKFSDEKPRGPLGSALLGVAFAAGWTPCIGPILGGIIGLAATSGGWKSGLILSSFYAAGLALALLGVGLLMNSFLSFYSKFRRHLHKVEVASGVLLIVIGLMVAFNILTWISSVVSPYVPNAENLVKQEAPAGASAAPFKLRGPYAVWKRLVRGELDPVMAVARGELRLEGPLTTLMMHVSSARALVACAQRVPTTFPDEGRG
jgi:hypothetical protein